jgi:hypothetical protein
VAIDSIDNHLGKAREFDRAAVPLGMYVAWCVNLGLVSDAVLAEHERMVLRVRMHDAQGSDLLTAMGGELNDAHLNSRGKEFTDGYYAGYLQDYAEVFGEHFYETEDNWDNYMKLTAVLTPKLLGPKLRPQWPIDTNKLRGAIKKRWQQLWH